MKLLKLEIPKLFDSEKVCSWSYSRILKFSKENEFRDAMSSVRSFGRFGGWSLSPNSLKALVTVLGDRKMPKIIEFGSGLSTLFLDRYYGNNFDMDSYEHQPEHAAKVKAGLLSKMIRVHTAELWQFSDKEYEVIMEGLIGIPDIYKLGKPLEKSLYSESRVHNVFYKIEAIPTIYDALILDGPHGNGRALAFSILRNRLKLPGYILIDDCNHYDFVSECSAFFKFNVLFGEIMPSKRWVLLEAKRK